jgi:hypothetical protein
MPKWFYVFPLHPKAKLTDGDKAILKAFFMKGSDGKAEKKEAKKADKSSEEKADKGVIK